jgi:hypothetical protein
MPPRLKKDQAGLPSTVIRKPRVVKLPVISREKLGDMVSQIERSRITLASRKPKFMHPWTVIPQWLPKKTAVSATLNFAQLTDTQLTSDEGIWTLQIMPGFVNGVPARLNTTADYISDAAKTFIEAEREKDPNSTQKGKPTGEEGVDVPLTEFPYLTVLSGDLRKIGEGAGETISVDASGNISGSLEAVPAVFKFMGVEDSQSTVKIGIGGVKVVSTGTSTTDASEKRFLRACDLVLKVERPSLKFDVEQGNPFLDGYSQIVTPRYSRNAKSRRYARIDLVPGPFTPPPELDQEEGVDRSGQGDPEWDYIKLATVYFISPLGAGEDSELTDKWQVEVKYDVFWNVCYMPAQIPSMLDPSPIRFTIVPLPGLAIATAMINGMLGPINDAVSRYIALLRAKRIRGTFWST